MLAVATAVAWDVPNDETELTSLSKVALWVTPGHGGVTSALTKERARRPIVTAIERDLRFGSAQDPIVKAVGQDFAARWMWVITGAIFLIAALSAVLGAGWQVWCLAKPG